jgi:hypothetical protein
MRSGERVTRSSSGAAKSTTLAARLTQTVIEAGWDELKAELQAGQVAAK